MTHDHHHSTNGPRREGTPDVTPPELLAVSSALDRLGTAERASAPMSLEDRVFMRTRAMLPAAEPLISRDSAAPIAVIRPASRGGWRVAAAAGLAFVGVIGAVMLSGSLSNRGGNSTGVASAEDTAALLEQIDSQFAAEVTSATDWSGTFDDLDAELARLESAGDGFWESGLDEGVSLEESM